MLALAPTSRLSYLRRSSPFWNPKPFQSVNESRPLLWPDQCLVSEGVEWNMIASCNEHQFPSRRALNTTLPPKTTPILPLTPTPQANPFFPNHSTTIPPTSSGFSKGHQCPLSNSCTSTSFTSPACFTPSIASVRHTASPVHPMNKYG